MAGPDFLLSELMCMCFRLILYFRCCFCTMCVDEGVLFWLQCVFVCVVEGGGAGRLADLNSSEMPTSTVSLVTN